MERDIKLEEFTDGKRYTSKDQVSIGCNGCEGCSMCCHQMSDTIFLDPYDVYMLECATSKSFTELLQEEQIELGMYDAVLLPHIKPKKAEGGESSEDQEACSFLDSNGRCTIHEYRPGYCRLFPLGRLYEDGGFSYIHQIYECAYPSEKRTPVLIRRWLGIKNLTQYETYISEWHYLIKGVTSFALEKGDEALHRALCQIILETFFIPSYGAEDFYGTFYKRMNAFKTYLSEQMHINL